MTDDLLPRLTRLIGETYTIERELGGGGMSRVFLGVERALERQIVVKVLDLQTAVEGSAERFRREIKVIAQLQHPHIVPILSAGGDGTLLWYAMPFVRGESLRARLVREGALPLADTLTIARELFDALATAHARGVVHRDIKPENILLEGRHAVVADFGVAKALAEAGLTTTGLTTAGVALGTPTYMAPEQALGEATTNHRADLYAAGAVLYEMLVGAPPYSGTLQAVIAAHLTAPIPSAGERRGDVPPALDQLLRRLLAKQPAERPQSAQEVLTALETMATPSGGVIGTVGGAATGTAASVGAIAAEAAATRRPAARGIGRLVAALVVLVAIAATGWWWRGRSTSAVVSGADMIAVMPLGSSGDSGLTRLGRDLVVTVSATLDGVGAIRTIDAMSVLAGTTGRAGPMSLEDARAIAAKLGAATLVHGSLVPEGDLVRADVALYPTAGGDAIARLSVRAVPSVAGGLTDSLATGLIRQIWRRGTPPSPLLADVTTSSPEALRLFLEGERQFETFDVTRALDTYARVTALDSNFAQAWLRIAQVRGLSVMPADTAVNRRLQALEGRLPERERELLQLQRQPMPLLERFATYEALAKRYPEHYMAQYRAGDIPIHTGPRVGIPVEAARPYIERLDVLAPRHYDNAQHQFFLAMAMDDTAGMLQATREMVARSGGDSEVWANVNNRILEKYAAGEGLTQASDLLAFVRAAIPLLQRSAEMPIYAFAALPPITTPATFYEALQGITRDPSLRPLHESAAVGASVMQFGRGAFAAGVDASLRSVPPTATVPTRTTAVRNAAYAVWFGLEDRQLLERALVATKPGFRDAPLAQRYEVDWAEGIAAIVAADSARLTRTLRDIADTSVLSRRVSQSLRNLWRERRTGSVDSLMAGEENAMQRSELLALTLPLHRAAIARALLAEGRAERAEHFAMWTDGMPSEERVILIEASTQGFLSYDRGRIAEARGDSQAALRHYLRFVQYVDLPPPALADQVKDAQRRIEALLAARR